MAINNWSDTIVIAELAEEPSFSEDLDALIKRIEGCEDAGPDVIVDLSRVAYVNSSNIAQMLRLRKALQPLEARMRICGANDAVWSVFMVTGLEQLFDFTDDVTVALASLQLLGD